MKHQTKEYVKALPRSKPYIPKATGEAKRMGADGRSLHTEKVMPEGKGKSYRNNDMTESHKENSKYRDTQGFQRDKAQRLGRDKSEASSDMRESAPQHAKYREKDTSESHSGDSAWNSAHKIVAGSKARPFSNHSMANKMGIKAPEGRKG